MERSSSQLYVDGMGWMVFIGRRKSKSTFRANNSFFIINASKYKIYPHQVCTSTLKLFIFHTFSLNLNKNDPNY